MQWQRGRVAWVCAFALMVSVGCGPEAQSARDMDMVDASPVVSMEMGAVGADLGETQEMGEPDLSSMRDQGEEDMLWGDMAGDEDAGQEMGAPRTQEVLLAMGHLGWLSASCDSGRSWKIVTNRYEAYRCGQPAMICAEGDAPLTCDCERAPETCQQVDRLDCDHSGLRATGLIQADDWLLMTRGWGRGESGIWRSRDGVQWEKVREEFKSSGLVYTQQTLMSGAASYITSIDDGESWSEPVRNEVYREAYADDAKRIIRAAHVVEYEGKERIIMTGEAGQLVWSDDVGETWSATQALPDECRGRFFASQGRLLIATTDAKLCWSDDGGETWGQLDIDPSRDNAHLRSNIVAHDGELKIMARHAMYYSADNGMTWQERPTSPALQSDGKVIVAPDGALVANQGRYDGQRFFRSEDGGVTWVALEESQYVKGHPIRFLRRVQVPATSPLCQP